MKTIFLFFAIAFSCTALLGQPSHRIIYYSGGLGEGSDFIIKNPTFQSRLVFNDSLSFYDHLTGLNGGKFGTLGHKLVHHAVMYNAPRNLFVEMVNFKGRYLIENDRKQNWTLLKEVKYVLGYKCFAAIALTERNDTIKAWYAPEINKPFGPANYRGLPGLILEVQVQGWNRHIIAFKFEKTNHRVVFPTHPIISAAEFRKRRKK